jgi:hypothetical protein
MKRALMVIILAGVALVGVVPDFAQAARTDAIWARKTTENIVLNGILSEASWAKAESLTVKFGIDNGIPGSGWKIESGVLPNDSTFAVLKLLVKDNQMYLGARIKDKSIGGSELFNRFDALLMSIKDHANGLDPKPPSEYFYTWWYPNSPDPQPVGQLPQFRGRWATNDGTPRDSTMIANWDAVTVVNGTSNTDAGAPDQGYTVEMRFNLTSEGYDVTRTQGDIVEWNIDVYDTDWFWPLNAGTFFCTRTWVQSPWGNQAWYDEVHVYAKPSVTVSSGPVPLLLPEFIVPDAIGFTAPTINGTLTEPVWGQTPGFRIHYGDVALRQSYPGVGPYRSGQYQPTVNGGVAAVLDPGDAFVKMFLKGNFLYLGFDVNDQIVQYHANIDRWDGFIVTINDRATRGPDKELLGRRLSFQVGAAGNAVAADYLLTLVGNGGATLALVPKAGSTVDTLGPDHGGGIDAGYTAELALDLTKLGYPSGLGDGALFIGVDLLDGDSFGVDYTSSYGTRTWWFRQYEGECCPAWALLSHAPLSGIEDGAPRPPEGYALLGSYPNPARQQTIRYALAEPSNVTLQVFDIGGRLIDTRPLGIQSQGQREVRYDAGTFAAGLYLYQLKVMDPLTGALRTALSGRLIVSQ